MAQPFVRTFWMYGKVCLGIGVVVAYTNDGYLRCLQMSHRDLRKPNDSGSRCLAFRRYKDMYISPSR